MATEPQGMDAKELQAIIDKTQDSVNHPGSKLPFYEIHLRIQADIAIQLTRIADLLTNPTLTIDEKGNVKKLQN